VAGLFRAWVYQYLFSGQVLPAPLVFSMKIKELVTPGTEDLVTGLTRLQADGTIFQALDQFLKLKTSGHLPVYQQDRYIGNLTLIDITNHLFNEYKIERHTRYTFTRSLLNYANKLKNLTAQIHLPEQAKFTRECEDMIEKIKTYI
jgi:signal-transduction protein with cAMP-binding, CBS, and nucleotidyltransferase domain